MYTNININVNYDVASNGLSSPTRFPSFFPATAHTLKYERSEELGKNLALGGIYRLPKFLKISKQTKFPQKNYRYNIIPLYFETFNKLKSTDIVCFRQNMSELRRLKD